MDCRHRAGFTYRQGYHFVLISKICGRSFKSNVSQNVNVRISKKCDYFSISFLICLSSNLMLFSLNERKMKEKYVYFSFNG